MQKIEAKQKELENTNSAANKEKVVKCFKQYLSTLRLEDTDFFTFTELEFHWIHQGL